VADAINFLEDPFQTSEAANVLYELKDKQNPTLHIDKVADKEDPLSPAR
tara:strand:- start:4772 stop:4918 length:147 start_codon:yes stop_codon:yes gene_type:complete